MKLRVLVTGGAGFIGSHTVDALLARGDEVICYDSFSDLYSPLLKKANISTALFHKNFRLVEGDVLDTDTLGRSARGCDAIIHFAAFAGVRHSFASPGLCAKVNVEGTLNVLESARLERASGSLGNFIFASSSSVYGLNSKLPFHEEQHLGKPISPYAATKIAGESLCHVYSHAYSIPITCLRFFTVYGPRQRPDMAIHKFTRLMDHGQPIEVYGDGFSTRDYTYCSDAIDAVLKALDEPRSFEIINLGNSMRITLRDVVELIRANLERVKGGPVEARINYLPAQMGDVPATHSDISKAQRLLDYGPKVDIATGVAQFMDWYYHIGRGLLTPATYRVSRNGLVGPSP